METNTLVTHKKMKSLGIGCVAKILKHSVKVNFGKEDVITTKESMLNIIDTSQCQTISFDDFRRKTFCNTVGDDSYVIVGNELKQYVGIGWISLRVITTEDLKKHKRVI